MAFEAALHAQMVFPRRVRVLVEALKAELPRHATVLDVGCGSGLIARRLMDERPDIKIEGVDVLVREGTEIPVKAFDGKVLPYGNGSFDAVMFVDVLHHAPTSRELLCEARRVARSAVVIKDHLREGLLAETTLRFMDWVGNRRHGVALPYLYWTRAEWDIALKKAGLVTATWRTELSLYPFPASLVFDRCLHFVGRFTCSEK